MKNTFFVIDEENGTFEYWAKGECITDCFDLSGDCAELMSQLAEFSDIPVYRMKILSDKEVNEIVKRNRYRNS